MLVGVGALPAAINSLASAGKVVTLPRHILNQDPQLAYVAELVRLAYSKLGESIQLRFALLEMQQSRSLAELMTSQSSFDVMWSVTNQEREQSGLRVIRVPIDRGLMGWRLLIVRAADLPRWQAVKALADMRRFIAGQGHDWPDTAILKANNLPVVTSTDYAALFRMLKVGRFDYFPRSIMEADSELAGRRHPELAIVPNLMISYPAAAYLFVSPSKEELASDLERGLQAAAADGSFQRLFRQYFGDLIDAHPVRDGRVFMLQNPLLPPEAAADRLHLRLRPGVAT